MAIELAPEIDPALDELRRLVIERRHVGRVHVEFRRVLSAGEPAPAVASALVETLAMRPPQAWTEIDASAALDVAASALQFDLASDAPVMKFDEADELARRFLASCGEDAVFVTNGSPAETSKGFGWTPITAALVDTGVIGVSPGRVAMFWVADDDELQG